MVISASRRTDIPLFFGDWFVRQLKKGRTVISNPYNPCQTREVPLDADHVEAFVFWTRNPSSFGESLDLLDKMRLPYYFLITINRYPDFLEPFSPELSALIPVLRDLKYRIGRERIIWRYDPIILSEQTSIAFHRDNFQRLTAELSPYSGRIIFSLVHLYLKVRKRFEKIGFHPFDIRQYPDMYEELLSCLFQNAHEHRMDIQGCAQEHLGTRTSIRGGKCIDNDLISSISGKGIAYQKDRGQRGDCGCHRSFDIGRYGTCGLDCLYCYAR